MNRKIFTLLASALMLFSIAFTVNAKIVGGDKSTGDVVRTLPSGTGSGMYHIRIDSIYNGSEWIGAGDSLKKANVPTFSMGDTVVLGVTEGGKVIPVSIKDLRTSDVGYKDLQSTMWCINVVVSAKAGQDPTFHFTNKAFGKEMLTDASNVFVGDGDITKGWMYSDGYDNGQLRSNWPIRRLIEEKDKDNRYLVLSYKDRGISAESKTVSEFLSDFKGKLTFSIVEVAPVVLDAEAFNTRLGETKDGSLTQLSFDPAPTSTLNPNYFGDKLKATDVGGTGGDSLYLILKVDGDGDKMIRNANHANVSAGDRYTNAYGKNYIKIFTGKTDGNYNNKYRFVYFPSKDSLVINAYSVHHKDHDAIADGPYSDNNVYQFDAPGDPQRYYGLYSDKIQDRLIVRLQDLFKDGPTLLTIGEEPANTRISFGIDNCNMETGGWRPQQGVYTIWDSRGLCLGVRIYNGSLIPQWMELEDGECPDRIPAYQWVVTHVADKQSKRVTITNREFGDLSDLAKMTNVLIKENELSTIFGGQTQFMFKYDPLKPGDYDGGFALRNSLVAGKYLATIDQKDCGTTSDESGFRAVTKEYAEDPYLGYKFFYVNTEDGNIDFGKSNDVGLARGMDYNAYAFNYYSPYDDTKYIDLKNNNGDTVLFVNKEGGREAFRFQLGTALRTASVDKYKPELYGYPSFTGNAKYNDNITYKGIPDGKGGTFDQKVFMLRRYYYELKVADFYKYRDKLAEQFVVLKGRAEDGSDGNKLTYGVANVDAGSESNNPFGYTNIYLRETYFLKKKASENEERKSQDDTRRVYYAILDRIESKNMSLAGDMGLEVPDTIKVPDGSSKYGFATWRVHEVEDGIIKAQGKSVSSVRVSTFALENVNYPLYRRLNSIVDDGAANDGKSPQVPYDAPKTLRIYTQLNNREFLHEDALSADADNKGGINFLGLANAEQHKEDGRFYNYNLYIDTAYINRGTGKIKPQYLIAVDVDVVGKREIIGVDNCNGEVKTTIPAYTRGRYLINATDSARQLGSTGEHGQQVRDRRYITNTSWDRLVFVDAIHVNDRLYIVGELQRLGVPESYLVKDSDSDSIFVDGNELLRLEKDEKLFGARNPYTPKQQYYGGGNNNGYYGAYYDFGTWANHHNDVTFSLRFTNPGARNAGENGLDGTDNDSKQFLIESETGQRNPFGNPKIAPVQGGWIKINNDVPVLSRGTYENAIVEADIFNVEKGNGVATVNDPVTSGTSLKVVSGTGELSILNASGKDVTITNILGQKVVATTLNSDNVTLKVPKGIVVVTVDGDSVKAIVK